MAAPRIDDVRPDGKLVFEQQGRLIVTGANLLGAVSTTVSIVDTVTNASGNVKHLWSDWTYSHADSKADRLVVLGRPYNVSNQGGGTGLMDDATRPESGSVIVTVTTVGTTSEPGGTSSSSPTTVSYDTK